MTAGAAPARAERSFSVVLDTLWTVGSAAGESLFVDPWYVAAGSGVVYVIDAGRGVLAFDRRGAPLARPPIAAAEVLGPATVLDDGRLAIVRRSDGALLVADRAGTRHMTASAGTREAQSVCAVEDGALLISGGDDRLTSIDRRGGAPARVPFPWAGLRDSSALLQQTLLASAAGGSECIIALMVGNGFAIMRRGDSVTFHEFIESIEVPPVRTVADTSGDRITTSMSFERRAAAATALALGDSSIFIGFGGSSPRRLGIIDAYDRAGGAYRFTIAFGAPVRGLAADGDVLYVLHVDSGVPSVAAVRLRPR